MIIDKVVQDIRAKHDAGAQEKGGPLEPFKHDSLQELYREILDAACYLRALLEEREHFEQRVRNLISSYFSGVSPHRSERAIASDEGHAAALAAMIAAMPTLNANPDLDGLGTYIGEISRASRTRSERR